MLSSLPENTNFVFVCHKYKGSSKYKVVLVDIRLHPVYKDMYFVSQKKAQEHCNKLNESNQVKELKKC